MPVSKISDAPASIKKLDDVALTLAQINQVLKWYDAYKHAEDSGAIESAMAVAIARFKREYKKSDGKWIKKEKKEAIDPSQVGETMAVLLGPPFPSEHSCRLEDPDKYVRCIRKSVEDSNKVDGYEPTGKQYDLLICYTENDEDSDVQAFHYKKSAWTAEQAGAHCRAHDGSFTAAKETKKEEVMAETNLDERPQQIRHAFDDQFRAPPLPTTDWLWVTEVFDDRVIVEASEHLYSVPYSEQDGEIVFAARDKWVEMERIYSPLSAVWRGIKSLYEQVQRIFAQPVAKGQRPSAGRLYILMDVEKRKLLVDEDGLIWKDLLVPGDWFRPDGKPVQVSKQDIDDVVTAFASGALPPVPIPFGHVEHLSGDDPANNNGFVRALRVGSDESPFEEPNGDYVLWGGLDITEPDTREKIERGSISNVSVWLEPDFHDLKDEDRVWPLVLWHVALTDKPQLTPELKNFVAFTATRNNRGGMIMSEKTQASGNQQGTSASEPTALEALQSQLAQLLQKVEQLEEKNRALEAQVQKDTTVIGKQQDDLHGREVETIVAALQGLGSHRMVKLAAHQMVPPVVISAVQPVLMADRPNGDGRSALTLSVKVGTEEKQVSATQMVLDVINAIAEANLLPDNLNRGKRAEALPPAEPKTPEQEKAEKDKAVEEYLKAHPEVKTGRSGR